MINQKSIRTWSILPVWLRFACALLAIISQSSSMWAAAAGTGAFQPLDLSKHFTDSSPTALAPLPQGQNLFNGVPFTLGGRIELTGINAARSGEFQAPQVLGIPVGQKANRLHLLLGARHGQKDGVPLATIVLRYKNGDTQFLRLAYGVHARNSFGSLETAPMALSDPNAQLAWETPETNKSPAARLYHVVLANPLPEAEIVHIDLLSLFSPATPIIFALTLQTGSDLEPLLPLPKRKVNQRAFQFADTSYRRPLVLRIVDGPSGNAVANATALLSLKDDATTYFFGQYASDASGQIQLAYPPQQAVALTARIRAPGLVPASIELPITDPRTLERPITVPLQKGVLIGGTIVDSAGLPVSNATVIPFIVQRTGTNLYTRTDLDSAQTGSDGKWSATALRDSITNLSLEIFQPDYHALTVNSAPTPELLSTNLRSVLQPHIRITGRVLDPNGKPLAKATVILDRGTNYPWQYTDAAGRYAFVVREATNTPAAVIAIATNLAPAYQRVALPSATTPVDLRLGIGSKYSMVLLDQSRRPVSGASVSLTSWMGSKAMQWRTETDKNGRFTWDHAPDGPVVFRFEKPGHYMHTHSTSLPNAGETTLTFGQRMVVAGRVIDSETQKPIEQFRARIRYKYQNGSGSTSTSGRRGTFSYNLGSSQYEEATVVIEARGYQPVSLTMRADQSGSFSNLFSLKKAVPTPGFVLTPNGKPAAGAEVVLIDKGNYAYMEEPGRFRKGYSDYEVVTADANGRFELTPKLEPDLVLAAHRSFGFAQVYATNVLNGQKVTLQPWAHVKGVIKVGEKVEPFYYVGINNSSSYSLGASDMRNGLYSYIKFKPDPDGRFSFDFVPPGNRTVHLRYQFEERDYGGMRLSHGVPIVAKPGETNDIVIGGTGRMVTGKATCTGPGATEVDWPLYSHTLRLNLNRAGVFSMLRQPMISTEYSLIMKEDGSFHIPNLPPGDYNLSLTAVIKTVSGGYRQVGNLSQRVTVPEGTTPFDLGSFVVKANR